MMWRHALTLVVDLGAIVVAYYLGRRDGRERRRMKLPPPGRRWLQ